MDLSEVLDDYGIAQYGVRGMRWGVRRSVGPGGLVNKTEGSSAPPGHASDGSQQKSSADHERATNALVKAQTHGRSSLSNEELAALTKRIESEKKFVQLTSGEKSALQKQVDQMRLEKDYRQLRAEAKQANQSTGRRIVDSILKSATNALMKEASTFGEQMVKDMLSGSGRTTHLTTLRKGSHLPKSSGKGAPKGKSGGAGVPKHGKSGGANGKPPPFQVNPDKVKFTKTPHNNLPNLKPTGP